MKIWRSAFLVLLTVNILAILALFLLITTPAEKHSLADSSAAQNNLAGNSVIINVTKDDFEGIANTYIQQAMADQPIPLALSVDDDVSLSTELEVFSITLPILLRFEPFVQEDGNLLLQQKSVEVGMLDIPPESALKLLRDSVELPDFMEVEPSEESVLLKLTEIPLDGGIAVRATSFNLEEDDIRLRVTIQR
ncbi:YpmS family protein [Planococcus sp. 107-1]|uniref:YpmS family protein n=1 Tax=Planococcus sp. 107-1 TaxID=2908840 RepID=UPI001F237DAC|nr:YpmS family protein [Planococcus sp. 107-1]UJF25600.1 YpmS family protein [Planococcus sp. 107-1]